MDMFLPTLSSVATDWDGFFFPVLVVMLSVVFALFGEHGPFVFRAFFLLVIAPFLLLGKLYERVMDWL